MGQAIVDPTPEKVKGVGQLTQPRCYALIFSLSPGFLACILWRLIRSVLVNHTVLEVLV